VWPRPRALRCTVELDFTYDEEIGGATEVVALSLYNLLDPAITGRAEPRA